MCEVVVGKIARPGPEVADQDEEGGDEVALLTGGQRALEPPERLRSAQGNHSISTLVFSRCISDGKGSRGSSTMGGRISWPWIAMCSYPCSEYPVPKNLQYWNYYVQDLRRNSSTGSADR